ncbi:MAG: M28 family peptidase [Oscillospiraceae bacterium]
MLLNIVNDKEYKIAENSFNTVHSDNGKSHAIINKSTAKQLEKYIEKDLIVTCDVEFNELFLENIIVTLKGKNNSEAILVTAHLDSVTVSGEKDYSKGVLDNGSGVALILDFIKQFEGSDYIPERDIIFSLVNSEEQAMVLGNGGSKEVNKLVSGKYDYFININLDCLGQKDINDLRYGIKGSVNETFISDLLTKTNNNEYNLIRDDQYGSDHYNFENSIYIYNFDKETILFHKEVDNKSNFDVKSLKKISNIIYETIKELSSVEKEKIALDINIDPNAVNSKCDDKRNVYSNTLEFGEYVFFQCVSPDICKNIDKHFYQNNIYTLTTQDISVLKKDEKLTLPFDESININATFDLPQLEYDNQELNVPYICIPSKSNFAEIKKLHNINSISYSYYLDAKEGKIYNFTLSDLTKQIGNYILDDIKNSQDYEEIVKEDCTIHKGSHSYNNEYITICIKNFDGTDYMAVVSSNIETPYTDDSYIAELTSELYNKIVK